MNRINYAVAAAVLLATAVTPAHAGYVRGGVRKATKETRIAVRHTDRSAKKAVHHTNQSMKKALRHTDRFIKKIF